MDYTNCIVPQNVLIDKERESLIICDTGNGRVVRWLLNNGIRGEVLVDNIDCYGLAMDKQECLYVSDFRKHEVRRFTRGDTKGIVVSGGNGEGSHLNQFNRPYHMFVDEQQSLYVSDYDNHRVMKWLQGAKQGIVVASGRFEGNKLTQLNGPVGAWVDEMRTVYVTESENHRVIRWPKSETREVVGVGGNGRGNAPKQFSNPQ
jgi:sugar lactone lactonase YvrE